MFYGFLSRVRLKLFYESRCNAEENIINGIDISIKIKLMK